MKEQVFKVGDKVKAVKSNTANHTKMENIGKDFIIVNDYGEGYKYRYVLNGTTTQEQNIFYSAEELLLVDGGAYDGLELLSAIAKGEFVAGDKFQVFRQEDSLTMIASIVEISGLKDLIWECGQSVTVMSLLDRHFKRI